MDQGQSTFYTRHRQVREGQAGGIFGRFTELAALLNFLKSKEIVDHSITIYL